MKKHLYLLFIIMILLIPTTVRGEENFKKFYGAVIFTDNNPQEKGYGDRYVSDSYVYEDGLYKLTGTVLYTSNVRDNRVVAELNTDVVFGCPKEQQCEDLKVFLLNAPHPGSGDEYINSFFLRDGLEYSEEIQYAYYSDEYELMENGHYRLVNPEHSYRYNIPRYKYVCDKVYKYNDCEKVGVALDVHIRSLLIDFVDDAIPFGASYTYSNGKYHLQEIEQANPSYLGFGEYANKEFHGKYTCFDKSDSCENLYKITGYKKLAVAMFLQHIYPAEMYYEVLEANLDEKTITMTIDDKEIIDNIKDTDKITVDDPNILLVNLEEGKGTIIPKKVGKTDITIISSSDSIRVLHVQISPTEKEEIVNPNTIDKIFISLALLITSGIILFIFYYKKRTN